MSKDQLRVLWLEGLNRSDVVIHSNAAAEHFHGPSFAGQLQSHSIGNLHRYSFIHNGGIGCRNGTANGRAGRQ